MKVAQESHWRLASNPHFLVAHYLDSPLSSKQQGTLPIDRDPKDSVLDNTHSQVKSTGHDHNQHADQTWVDQHDQLRLCSKLP